VPFLFDTDAISEALRKRPAAGFLSWLSHLPRADQFASAVSIGEMYRGAFRSPDRERHLRNIEERVLPALTVLPFDTSVARIYGELHAALTAAGRPLADADLQIAATALRFDLELVTGNLRHFSRIPGLVVNDVLSRSREK
jgi:predicted nucleic acid-binding protein